MELSTGVLRRFLLYGLALAIVGASLIVFYDHVWAGVFLLALGLFMSILGRTGSTLMMEKEVRAKGDDRPG